MQRHALDVNQLAKERSLTRVIIHVRVTQADERARACVHMGVYEFPVLTHGVQGAGSHAAREALAAAVESRMLKPQGCYAIASGANGPLM